MSWFGFVKKPHAQIHPLQKFCFRCGFPMDFPHDEHHFIEYDIETGKARFMPYKIRSTDLQYCMNDNVYITKRSDGTWQKGYDIMEILHYIV